MSFFLFSHRSKVSGSGPGLPPLDGTGLPGPPPDPLVICSADLSWRLQVQAVVTLYSYREQPGGIGEDKAGGGLLVSSI